MIGCYLNHAIRSCYAMYLKDYVSIPHTMRENFQLELLTHRCIDCVWLLMILSINSHIHKALNGVCQMTALYSCVLLIIYLPFSSSLQTKQLHHYDHTQCRREQQRARQRRVANECSLASSHAHSRRKGTYSLTVILGCSGLCYPPLNVRTACKRGASRTLVAIDWMELVLHQTGSLRHLLVYVPEREWDQGSLLLPCSP